MIMVTTNEMNISTDTWTKFGNFSEHIIHAISWNDPAESIVPVADIFVRVKLQKVYIFPSVDFKEPASIVFVDPVAII